ncbi:wall-associated receptor kinase 4-like [Aristolochia californica]|uniref:wall-associated receptor kinase 4-like n=1 Tax=Aristolochia californica TaxID=171875 RepID=UPI0035D72061
MASFIAAVYLPLYSGAEKSFAVPGCPDTCGGVNVSYPFGIGGGCFLPGFEVRCVESVPSLPQVNLQILEILQGEVRVNSTHLIAESCVSSPARFEAIKTVSLLENSPYTFSSSSNKLFVVGCNNTGVVINGIEATSMCTTICHAGERIEPGSCKGQGCCQTVITTNTKLLRVSVYGMQEEADFIDSSCGYAFVAEDGDYSFAESDLWNFSNNGPDFRMKLEWAIGGEEDCNKVTDMACKGNSLCIESKRKAGYICKCIDGFEGNPYLTGLQGCQDIDGCQTSRHNCEPDATCRNKIPGFECDCPPWTSGDGHLNGTGCHRSFLVTEAASVVVGGVVIISISYWGHKKKRDIKLRQKYFQKNGGLFLQHYLCSSNMTAVTRLKIFSAEELTEATNNYNSDNIMNLGGRETLYRGNLNNGTEVVIKMSETLHPSQSGKFVDEIVMLTQFEHKSINKALGCCLETRFPLVVYEFFSDETLYQKLHGKAGLCKPLKWKERHQIAVEIAEALVYLHSFASMPIIHGDVRSSNVLLDTHNNVKIADFGTARLIPVSEDEGTAPVRGTLGYLDPEYYSTGILTERSDVYSFGVVLIELLAGSKPFLHEVTQEYASLVMQFRSRFGTAYLFETLDEGLLREARIEELQEVADIANRCLAAAGQERPTMKWVHKELNQVGLDTDS